MKRPFLSVALLYLGGIAVGEWLPANLTLLFSSALVAAALGVFVSRWRPVLLAIALILTGWFNICRHSAILSPNDLRLLLGDKPELVCARGALAAPPKGRFFERNDKEVWHSTAILDVNQIQRDGRWQPAFGKISISTPGALEAEYFEGEAVEVSGVIGHPGSPVAPGLFDSRNFLRRQGIYFELNATTNEWGIWKTDSPQAKPLATRFHAWVKRTLARGLPVEDQAVKLTWTLMLDWRAPMTQSVQDPFVKAGTFHIFAVDGLRIGMISAILLLFFRVIRVPREISGFVVIFVIWFYTALTGFPASAIRATIMMTVVIFGWAIRRPGDLMNSLFAAAFIILLWDPSQLFLPGFQLSFGVLFYIALLLKPLEEWATAKFGGDPFLPDHLKWTAYVKPRSWGRFGYETLLMSVVAWLGSMPLTAHYFHIWNWISLPANCLVVPMTMAALASNLASLAVAPFWPFGTELFNHSSWLLMHGIIKVSTCAARLPTACFNLESPSMLTTALFYAALGMFATGWIFRTAYKRIAYAALAVTSVLWIGQEVYDCFQTRLYILPLEGGHAMYVENMFERKLLVDSGNARPAEVVTAPFLRAQGVNLISTFCLSDAAQRQMGGADLVSSNFMLGRVAYSAARARSPGFKQFVSGLEKSHRRSQLIGDGDSIRGWTVLNPPSSTRLAPADDNAIVLRKEINGITILFVSDLSRSGQARLLERHPELHTDIVISGLPARDEPLSASFLEVIHPKLIVIADSDYPAPRRAPPALRKRLAAQAIPVLFCRDTGALTFIFGPFGWHIEDTDGKQLTPKHTSAQLPEPDAEPNAISADDEAES